MSYIVPSAELLSERSCSKDTEPCDITDTRSRGTPLASGDWLRTLSLSLRDRCVSRKEPFPRQKGSGESFPLALRLQEEPFRQPSQKWLHNYYFQVRFECCENSQNILGISKDTLVGITSAPELMGHVVLPCNWKEFLYHKGCSFNMKSILEQGLISGGKETKEGRRTIFFTPLNPFGKDEEEEAVHGDLSVQRRLHYSSDWKHDQDAVYWVKIIQCDMCRLF